MSCAPSLLRAGIWIFASGLSLLLASALNYQLLTPIEKQQLLDDRNGIVRRLKTTSKLPLAKKGLDFSV